jgi:hypothetical protein
MRKKKFKLLSQIKGNSIKNFYFLKVKDYGRPFLLHARGVRKT